jgi:hypothetical protein
MKNKRMTFLTRRLLPAAAIGLVLIILLWLDLANRGLAWQALWSLTGEENPLAQIRGAIELPGNLLRPPLRTEPLAPIANVGVNPFGINTFLEQEVEVAKRDRQVQMIAEAGFGWIRQEFPWEDIEIHGRGDFTDRRNDVNGDGVIDEISAWDKYDHIVEVIEQYGLQLQVRLSNPPAWTHADPAIGEKAPPDDLQDFVNYAVAVAERYRGRITHYQIWNEPNIYPEWGEQAVNPEGYTEMLCRTYDALKAVDPNIVIISAALAPTINLTERNLSDLVFLQRMYDAGAGRCFDIMSTQGYGFFSGPTDERQRPTTLTFSHHRYLRDIMVANGDAHKPIWLAEAAWNAQPEDPTLVTSQYGNFGIVSEAEAARYMPLAYEESAREYPWLGVINYWFFKRAGDSERNQAFYYFRMVEPDFTPLPVYDSMRQYIASETPRLYPGTHQAEHRAITPSPDMRMTTEADAQLGSAMRAAGLTFTACGTDIRLRWHSEAALRVRVDEDTPVIHEVDMAREGWTLTTLHESLLPRCVTITMDGVYDGLPLAFDAVIVQDRSNPQGLLLLVGAGLIVGLFVYTGWAGWQSRSAL